MSVYIPGMEMPNNCRDCPLEDAYEGYNCRIVEKSANWGLEGRPSWCPLVPAADAIEAKDRLILTLQNEMMAEAESHIAEAKRLNEWIEKLANNLPKVDNKFGEWVSVTERLPDDRRDVQITVFWHDAWRTMYGYYDGAFWHLYAPMHTEVADVEVIGWMEKPAPMPFPKLPEEVRNCDS